MDNRITNSQIGCLKTCPRMHYLRYILGIRPEDQGKALRIGSAFHVGLDYKAQGYDAGQALSAAMQAYEEGVDTIPDERLPDFFADGEILRQLLWAYFMRWEQMDSEMEVVATELQFELPILNPDASRKSASKTYVIAGKIDKIVRLPSGDLALMEHKTTSSDLEAGSDYFLRLRIDNQISIYLIAAQMLGHNVNRILYDVIKKPRIRPKQLTQKETTLLVSEGKYEARIAEGEDPVIVGEGYEISTDGIGSNGFPSTVVVNQVYQPVTPGAKGYSIQETLEMFGDRLRTALDRDPDKWFARREISRLESDLIETKRDLWEQTQILQARSKTNRWSRNDRACIGFGRCTYFSLCTQGFNPNQDEDFTVPEGFYRTDNMHEELEEAEELT